MSATMPEVPAKKWRIVLEDLSRDRLEEISNGSKR
jgi:hypothetical protein